MSGAPKRHILHPNVTEVGSERTGGPHLQLFGPNIQPRHCVIAHTDGLVTVTPCSRDAEVFVNGQRIFETSILQVSLFCLGPILAVYVPQVKSSSRKIGVMGDPQLIYGFLYLRVLLDAVSGGYVNDRDN